MSDTDKTSRTRTDAELLPYVTIAVTQGLEIAEAWEVVSGLTLPEDVREASTIVHDTARDRAWNGAYES